MSDRQIENLITRGHALLGAARTAQRSGQRTDAKRYLVRAGLMLDAVKSARLCQAIDRMAATPRHLQTLRRFTPVETIAVPRSPGVLAA